MGLKMFSLYDSRHLAHTLVQLPGPRLLPCLPDTRRELTHPPLIDDSKFLKVGTRWLNFVLAPSVLVPLPLLFLVVEQYKRADLDD